MHGVRTIRAMIAPLLATSLVAAVAPSHAEVPRPLLAATEGCEVLLRSGERRAGRAITLAAEGPATASLVDASGAAASVPLDDLVAIEWQAAATTGAPGEMTLLLHDGSRLPGRIVGGDEEACTLELAAGGAVELPLDSIRAILAGPRHATLDVGALPAIANGDSLHRRREVGGDHTRGTLVAVDGQGVRFEYVLGVGSFAWSDVEAVVLEQQLAAKPPRGRVVEVDFLRDGTLVAELVRLTGSELVVLPLATGEELAIARAAIGALRFRGDAWRWLSDLAPSAVMEVPYLGGADDFLFRWRADRSVTGHPVRIAGRRFGKGIGCHSRCELRWTLPAGAKRFVASVGLSDEVLALADPGAVEFVVAVDGEERWRSGTLRGGEGPRRVPPIELAGARELALLVDFAAGEDVADRALWADALLLD